MFSALKQIFAPSPLKQQAHEAYVQIVAQSRLPVFYSDWQVDDTVDGRFDIIVLHMYLVISRCEEELHHDMQLFTRFLSEVFFSDMDRSLREMGSSDTGVGMRVKKMAQAFYGRLKAYQLAGLDEADIAEALKRNAYRDKPVARESAAALAAYVARNQRALRLQSLDKIMHGIISFSR